MLISSSNNLRREDQEVIEKREAAAEEVAEAAEAASEETPEEAEASEEVAEAEVAQDQKVKKVVPMLNQQENKNDQLIISEHTQLN